MRHSKDIGRIFVFHFTDGFARVVSYDGVTVSQRFQMILYAVNIQRIAFQR